MGTQVLTVEFCYTRHCVKTVEMFTVQKQQAVLRMTQKARQCSHVDFHLSCSKDMTLTFL